MKFSDSSYSKNSMRGVGSNLKTPPSRVLDRKDAEKYGYVFSYGPLGPRKIPTEVTVTKGSEVSVFPVSAQILHADKRKVTYKLFICDVPFGQTVRIKQINLNEVEVNL